MALFLIPDHVHVCVIDGAAVMLDLRRDRYYGFDAEQSAALHAVVQGWPRSGKASAVESTEGRALAEKLVKRRLLTKNVLMGKSSAVVQARLPEM
ncbi:MAG: hypothetical protein ACREMY_21440, partial [bacterium]